MARLVDELDRVGIRAWFDINELSHDTGRYTRDVETSDFIIQEEVEYALNIPSAVVI